MTRPSIIDFEAWMTCSSSNQQRSGHSSRCVAYLCRSRCFRISKHGFCQFLVLATHQSYSWQVSAWTLQIHVNGQLPDIQNGHSGITLWCLCQCTLPRTLRVMLQNILWLNTEGDILKLYYCSSSNMYTVSTIYIHIYTIYIYPRFLDMDSIWLEP